MAGPAIPFLLYGSFRIDEPQIEARDGIATPLATNAGTIALPFDGSATSLEIDFQNPRAKFAVSVEGDGYRVTNPTPGLFIFPGVQISKTGNRYAHSQKLSALTPTGIACSDIAVNIGERVTPKPIDVHEGIPLSTNSRTTCPTARDVTQYRRE